MSRPAFTKQKRKQNQLLITTIKEMADDADSGWQVYRDRILAAIVMLEPYYVAKVAIYIREAIGMQQLTYFIAHYLSLNWADDTGAKRRFFSRVVKHPEDVIGILSYGGGRPSSHAERMGLHDCMSKFPLEILSETRKINGMSLLKAINAIHVHSADISAYKKGCRIPRKLLDETEQVIWFENTEIGIRTSIERIEV
ncbi:MAG: hypothetical protein FWD45_04530 [Coriobacteriia bacterium]|nr:hypothetical protein [Coriobacteriia bacterium]